MVHNYSTVLWGVIDVNIIIIDSNGVLYENQVAGRNKDEIHQIGYLAPFPSCYNKEFKQELLNIFYNAENGGYLSENENILNSIKLLLNIFKLDDYIELDMTKLHLSCDQWIYIRLKNNIFYDAYQYKNIKVLNDAVITWSYMNSSDIKPINYINDILSMVNMLEAQISNKKILASFSDFESQKIELKNILNKQLNFLYFQFEKIQLSLNLIEDIILYYKDNDKIIYRLLKEKFEKIFMV